MKTMGQVSERFSRADSDLTVVSADAVHFKVHRKNLEVHSEILANMLRSTITPAEGPGGILVQLLDTAPALEILFQYMYSQPQPDLAGLEFALLARVAETAEKYVVHAAMPFLRAKMRDHVEEYPLEVLIFARGHNLKDLGNAAAHKCLDLSLETAAAAMPQHLFIQWAIFHDKWYTQARSDLASCSSYTTYAKEIISRPTVGYEPPAHLRQFRATQHKHFFGYLRIEFME